MCLKVSFDVAVDVRRWENFAYVNVRRKCIAKRETAKYLVPCSTFISRNAPLLNPMKGTGAIELKRVNGGGGRKRNDSATHERGSDSLLLCFRLSFLLIIQAATEYSAAWSSTL